MPEYIIALDRMQRIEAESPEEALEKAPDHFAEFVSEYAEVPDFVIEEVWDE